jgi:hypothetical protein
MDFQEQAQSGLSAIEGAITQLLRAYPDGLTNGEITKELALESDQNGKQQNYLSWSVLGRMMKKNLVIRARHQRTGERASKFVYRLIQSV